MLIYIMLTGYPPFYSDTPTKVISRGMKKKIMAGNYEFVDEDWAHISDSAKDLVARWVVLEYWWVVLDYWWADLEYWWVVLEDKCFNVLW